MDNNNGMEPTSSSSITESIFLRVAKTTLLAALVYFVLYYPLGDPFLECKSCSSSSCQECSTLCCLYWMTIRAACNTIETTKIVMRKILDILYDCKLRLYILLETLDHDDFCAVCRISTSAAMNTDHSRVPQKCKCGRNCCRRRTFKNEP
ncbi:uncharacterized protein LOC121740460 [Aricia agestis]|uniref:uncharacterized protein LOC121740460 n=1 Tax=Aricia agestis TaxID=91739 RepID=UPI001C2024CD|nr:uncharacterized protein LOC121740460 [Aricia agestis]